MRPGRPRDLIPFLSSTFLAVTAFAGLAAVGPPARAATATPVVRPFQASTTPSGSIRTRPLLPVALRALSHVGQRPLRLVSDVDSWGQQRGTDPRQGLANTRSQVVEAAPTPAPAVAPAAAPASARPLPTPVSRVLSSSSPTTTTGCTSENWRSLLGPDEAWIDRRESGLDPDEVNPHSGAFGLGQLLPSTYRGYDLGPVSRDPCSELAAQRTYMAKRYGSWSAARSFWVAHDWW